MYCSSCIGNSLRSAARSTTPLHTPHAASLVTLHRTWEPHVPQKNLDTWGEDWYSRSLSTKAGRSFRGKTARYRTPEQYRQVLQLQEFVWTGNWESSSSESLMAPHKQVMSTVAADMAQCVMISKLISSPLPYLLCRANSWTARVICRAISRSLVPASRRSPGRRSPLAENSKCGTTFSKGRASMRQPNMAHKRRRGEVEAARLGSWAGEWFVRVVCAWGRGKERRLRRKRLASLGPNLLNLLTSPTAFLFPFV